MVKKFSILHISDLHKPENCSLDNVFYSLQKDCDAYIKDGIGKPEIIVVSGDLVEGSKNDDAENIIKLQYAEVSKFLDKLVSYFLNGDKSRMVIVPGNHDYCYKISKESMTLSLEEMANEDLKQLKSAEPSIRWNWDERRFYHITNWELYATRFDLFNSFYNEFFKGIREIPAQADQDSYIVELPSYNIAFVCFNSCYRLDHLNPMGCICPDGITKAHDRLAYLKNMGYLLVGVWHHHVSGLPEENNYMDYRILNAMMQEDIKMGLFGHQHRSTAVQEYSDITSKQSILLISSGSLYGNHYKLVTGVPRQYNIIEISLNHEDVVIQLNVRKDHSQYGYDIPQWTKSPIGIMNLLQYRHEIQIEKPQIEYIVEDIDKKVRLTKNYGDACLRLMATGLDNELILRYFDNYISKVCDNNLLKTILKKPLTITQYMTVLDAAVTAKDKDWIIDILSNEQFQDETNPYVRELKEKAKKIM